MLTGTDIRYVEWLNTMFERPSFNSRGLTMQLRVLHTVTNRAVHPAACHSFIFPPHPPWCRLNTCVDRTERFVTHLVTCARGHRWPDNVATWVMEGGRPHKHTHAGTDTYTCRHRHTNVQWSYILAQESTSTHVCRCRVNLWRHNDLNIYIYDTVISLTFAALYIRYLTELLSFQLIVFLSVSLSLSLSHTWYK